MRCDMTRRQYLMAAGGTLGVVGGAYGVSTQVSLNGISMWSPTEGTWPLPRYDLGRTGATQASSPRNPSKRWERNVTSSVDSLVVGPKLVYVGSSNTRANTSSGIVALTKDDGTIKWKKQFEGRTLALYDGTLYGMTNVTDDDDEAVVALEAATGERQWISEFDNGVGTVLPTEGAIFHDYIGGVVALDPDSGEKRWAAEGISIGSLAIDDNSIFATTNGLCRYQPRRVSDAVFNDPPPTEWTSGTLFAFPRLVASGSTVFVSGNPTTSTPEEQALHAIGQSNGEEKWTAVNGSNREGTDPITVTPLAVDNGVVYTPVRRGQSPGQSNTLVALSVNNGNQRWRKKLQGSIYGLVLTKESILISTQHNPNGIRGIQAFSRSGHRQWEVELERTPLDIAPVDDTLYVGASGGRVIALS